MSLRFALIAATVGLIGFAAPASAVMQEIHVPDPNAPAQNGGPPDGLFDKSVPSEWQDKQDSNNPHRGNAFHFTMSSSSGSSGGYNQMGTTSAYDTAKRAGSEFYQPGPQYTVDPFVDH